MITKALESAITAEIDKNEITEEKPLKLDSVTVFLLDSKAFKTRPPGLMPAGNFEYKGKNYAVYFS